MLERAKLLDQEDRQEVVHRPRSVSRHFFRVMKAGRTPINSVDFEARWKSKVPQLVPAQLSDMNLTWCAIRMHAKEVCIHLLTRVPFQWSFASSTLLYGPMVLSCILA